MQIVISAGGVGGISVADFQSDMRAYISNADSIISSFKAIKKETCNLSGGIGNLQDALDEIDQRVRKEETALHLAKSVQAKVDNFIRLAERVDRQVAADVNRHKDELYRVSSWSRPRAIVEDTPWYTDAWNWLCGVGEDIAEGAEKAWDWISDTAKKAWNGLVEFYNENKHLCQILIGVAAIAVAVVVTVVTGGAAVPALLAMAKAAITAGLISAAIGGSISAVMTLASGESLEVALENALNSAVDGFCSGFMWGGIFAAGSQIVSAIKTASQGATVASNATKVQSAKKPYEDSRPPYKEGQVEEVWKNAQDKSGKVYDPSGKEIVWDRSKPRNGQWDMGHKPNHKYSDMHKKYMDGKITKEQFLDWYHNPKNYRPELPGTNRSHQYEIGSWLERLFKW